MVKKYDDIAWEYLLEREIFPDDTFGPQSFMDVEHYLRQGEPYTLVFPSFLDAFYRTRNPRLFSTEPSTYFSPCQRAFFAGVVEFLTKKFGLETPAWVEKAEFFLKKACDPSDDSWQESGAECPTPLAERLAAATHEFRRRNVVFQARSLIRL